MPEGVAPAAVPMVRVVVLNYNGDPHLYRCLEALAATQWPSDRLQVVVIDNASADGSPDVVADRFPAVELRRLATNTGFPANNEALRDLNDVDLVALINNDAFVTPGWLAPLVAALEEDPELAAACPKLVFAPHFVELAVASATFGAPGDARPLGVRLSGVEVEGVDSWRSAQFPPPGFWGLERGRAQGWRYRYVPTSVVRHQHATTSVEGSVTFNRYVERNRLMMLTKNAPARLVLAALAGYLAATVSYARRDVLGPLRRARRPRFGVVGLRLVSLGSYLRWLPALLVDRHRLRSAQQVSDQELSTWFRVR